MDRHVFIIESSVPRTLAGMRPPNVAIHAPIAFDDASLWYVCV